MHQPGWHVRPAVAVFGSGAGRRVYESRGQSSPAQPAAQADRQRRGCSLVFANIGGAVVGRLATTLGLPDDHSWFCLARSCFREL
jgi:hypothetical protein